MTAKQTLSKRSAKSARPKKTTTPIDAEAARKARAQYYADHKEKILEYHKTYYSDNKEKYRQWYAKWAANNKEKIAQYGKTYREKHKNDKPTTTGSKRKSRKTKISKLSKRAASAPRKQTTERTADDYQRTAEEQQEVFEDEAEENEQ